MSNGVEGFAQAEEEANRLVDELSKLKLETESYRTSRAALGEAAQEVGRLAARLGDVAEGLGGIAETLRKIGTPELLRAQEHMSAEVAALRQDLGTQVAATKAAVDGVRKLALGTACLVLVSLALVVWLALSLGRG